MSHFAATVALIGIVIIVASLLSGALERRGIPLVAAFLVLGAVIGPHGLGLLDIGLRSPILFALATLGLAVMLFSDAVTVDTREVGRRKRLAFAMLVPGTLLPAAVIAMAAALLLDLPPAAAAIIGAALSSTDPVLLRSTMKSSLLPPGPRVALRLETGMNDVVLLPIVAIAILILQRQGGTLPMGELSRHALGLFLLGPVLGALVGWIGITLLSVVRTRIGVRRDYESLYAIGLALCAFAAAESAGGSGFLAAFAAGFVIATQDVELCDCFLEYGEATAEMLLLLTFVALGTSLIWSGLTVLDGPVIAFALIAIVARTVVLWPLLLGARMDPRDAWLVAAFGPRGLASLLLVLLAVFAGAPHAEQLFTIACLVVLMSIVVHGAVIALHTRRIGASAHREAGVRATLVVAQDDRISIDEVKDLQQRGEDVVIADSRSERGWKKATTMATGAVRLPPDDPVTSARAKKLSQHATLVVYCA